MTEDAGHRNGAARLEAVRAPSDRLTVDADGILRIAGHSVRALVERFGSPLQVAVEPTLRANYRAIRDAFARSWPAPVNVLYAIKCNNNLAIRAVLNSEGAGGDCFGLGELYATLAGGADPRRLAMNGSNKSADEVAAAVQLGVTINVDAVDEIEFLRAAARITGRRARVNLRLKIAPTELEGALLPSYRTPEGAAANIRRMKWGFTPEAARPLLAALARVDGVELVGFSTHVGHLAIEPRAFALVARDFGRAVRELEQASGIVARLLDIGGGWPQHREPSAREFLVNRWTIDDYADAASAALRDALGPRDSLPELWLEPGRFIAGSAQLLLARVGAVKRDAGHVWIHVDASTNDLPRIESGRHWYHLLPASRMHAPLRERVEIVGGTCFRAVLGDDRAMPELRRDDLIAILDTGMYAEVFANQFNGLPRPATILVDETRASLIRHRESIADVFAHHRVPPHLAAQSPRHGDSDAVLRWAARGFDGAVA